jgi:hypothetical protein
LGWRFARQSMLGGLRAESREGLPIEYPRLMGSPSSFGQTIRAAWGRRAVLACLLIGSSAVKAQTEARTQASAASAAQKAQPEAPSLSQRARLFVRRTGDQIYQLHSAGKSVGEARVRVRAIDAQAGAELEWYEEIELSQGDEHWTTSCYLGLLDDLPLLRIAARHERAGKKTHGRVELEGRKLIGYRNTRRLLRQLPRSPACTTSLRLRAILFATAVVGETIEFSGYDPVAGSFQPDLRLIRAKDSLPPILDLASDGAQAGSGGASQAQGAQAEASTAVKTACVELVEDRTIVARYWIASDGALIAFEERCKGKPSLYWQLDRVASEEGW